MEQHLPPFKNTVLCLNVWRPYPLNIITTVFIPFLRIEVFFQSRKRLQRFECEVFFSIETLMYTKVAFIVTI